MEEAKIVNLYDLTHTQAAPLLSQWEYPWEALSGIGDFILEPVSYTHLRRRTSTVL